MGRLLAFGGGCLGRRLLLLGFLAADLFLFGRRLALHLVAELEVGLGLAEDVVLGRLPGEQLLELDLGARLPGLEEEHPVLVPLRGNHDGRLRQMRQEGLELILW